MKRITWDNVAKSYVYSFVSSFSFSEAIWVLYLAHRGMSLVQIGLLESIFHVTSMLMEVPTGIVADRFGRKTSRALSRVVAFVSTILMLASRGFGGFAFSFVLVALSYNLESGAGDALVYDSLVDHDREGEFMRVKGRQEIAFQAAHGLSLLAGGLIATWSYELAYILNAAFALASLGLALGFEEPLAGRKGRDGTAGGLKGLVAHVRDSVAVIRGNRGIFVYILFTESFGLFYTTLYFYFQTFLKSSGYKEWAIGLVLAASAAASVVMATLAHRLEKRLGRKSLVRYAPFIAIVAYGLIAFTGLESPAMVLLSAVEGLLFVSFSDYINRMIPSASRATLLSFQAMVFSVMMILFFPLVGALAERHGFKTAFAVIFAASIIVLLGARRMLLARIGRDEAEGEGLAEKAVSRY